MFLLCGVKGEGVSRVRIERLVAVVPETPVDGWRGTYLEEIDNLGWTMRGDGLVCDEGQVLVYSRARDFEGGEERRGN